MPGQVCFEVVGYLLEELRDADNLTTFNKDMQDANIFVGSLIFIEELADKVLHACWQGWDLVVQKHCTWGSASGPKVQGPSSSGASGLRVPSPSRLCSALPKACP